MAIQSRRVPHVLLDCFAALAMTAGGNARGSATRSASASMAAASVVAGSPVVDCEQSETIHRSSGALRLLDCFVPPDEVRGSSQ